MESSAEQRTNLGDLTRRLVRIRVWLSEKVRFSDLQATLLWAAVVGFLGAWTSIGFREGTEWLHERLRPALSLLPPRWNPSRITRRTERLAMWRVSAGCPSGSGPWCRFWEACWRA
jgi:hypothetical protein